MVLTLRGAKGWVGWIDCLLAVYLVTRLIVVTGHCWNAQTAWNQGIIIQTATNAWRSGNNKYQAGYPTPPRVLAGKSLLINVHHLAQYTSSALKNAKMLQTNLLNPNHSDLVTRKLLVRFRWPS